MKFGAHMSISGGLHKAFGHGERAGCDTIQIFSKNQQQWHLINLASPSDELWEKSIAAFGDELERGAALGIPYLVTHPGAHTGSGEETGLLREAAALNRLLDAGVGGPSTGSGQAVTILLETTAGQGSALGYRFEHLARLIELVDRAERLGVCVDTCHILAAGYDIRTPEACAATFDEFDRVVGIERIKAFHLNDSQKDLGSRADRHTHIGAGCVGLEGFRAIVNDPRFASLPMILETPKGEDLAEDIENLAKLRELIQLPHVTFRT